TLTCHEVRPFSGKDSFLTLPANTSEISECGLISFASVQALPAQIPALRRKPHPQISVTPGLLKYADEQAVIAVAAVLQAIQDFELHGRNFTDWGVVAAPRFLGREACAASLDKFMVQGALGVSPLLVAYQSLHAVAGSISLALRIQGPNMG